MYLKNCTDAEIEVFFVVANTHGLDPVKKEVYLQKFDGQMQPVVTRDGLLETDIIWDEGPTGEKEGYIGVSCRVKTLDPKTVLLLCC